MRRSLAWLVAVPLMLAGSQVAHVLAYRVVYPQTSIRLQALVETGHGYMKALPLVLGVAGAVVLLSLAATVVDAAQGRGVRPLPPWAFALLPVAGFAIQEYVERWLSWGFFPWYAALQPTFLIGIALQLPFGAPPTSLRDSCCAARNGSAAASLVSLPHGCAWHVPVALAGGAAATAVLIASLAPSRTARPPAPRLLRRPVAGWRRIPDTEGERNESHEPFAGARVRGGRNTGGCCQPPLRTRA